MQTKDRCYEAMEKAYSILALCFEHVDIPELGDDIIKAMEDLRAVMDSVASSDPVLELKNMLGIMKKFNMFGTCDTEPSEVLVDIIEKKYERRPYRIPENSKEWQLYSDNPGVEAVAKNMSKQALKIMNAMNNITEDQYREMKKVLWF